jgi:hypothetical protein
MRGVRLTPDLWGFLAAAVLCLAGCGDVAGELRAALPEPLPGWARAGIESVRIGRGHKVFAEYRETGGRTVVKIDYHASGDPADLDRRRKRLADPALAKAAGWEIAELAGRKWQSRVIDGTQRRTYLLETIAGDRVIVTITTYAESRAPLEAYARAIDYRALARAD